MVTHLPSLTGLRGFAALYVFVLHYQDCIDVNYGLANSGSTAVSMFFVLSGFIMMYNYGAVNIVPWRFWYKRWWRIMPVYYISLLMSIEDVQCIWGKGVPPINGNSVDTLGVHHNGECTTWKWVDIGLHLFGMNTWIPIYPYAWNAVTWSIQTEMAFYFAFPFLLRIFNYIVVRWGRKGWNCMLVGTTIYTCLSTIVLLCIQSPQPIQEWRVYIMPATRIGEFVMGILAASWFMVTDESTNTEFTNILEDQIGKRRDLALHNPYMTTFFVTLLSIIVALSGLNEVTAAMSKYGITALPFAMCLVVLAVADTHDNKSIITRVLQSSVAQRMGDISFCFYLIHNVWKPMMIWTNIPMMKYNIALPYLILTIVVSSLMHYGVEKRLYNWATSRHSIE